MTWIVPRTVHARTSVFFTQSASLTDSWVAPTTRARPRGREERARESRARNSRPSRRSSTPSRARNAGRTPDRARSSRTHRATLDRRGTSGNGTARWPTPGARLEVLQDGRRHNDRDEEHRDEDQRQQVEREPADEEDRESLIPRYAVVQRDRAMNDEREPHQHHDADRVGDPGERPSREHDAGKGRGRLVHKLGVAEEDEQRQVGSAADAAKAFGRQRSATVAII